MRPSEIERLLARLPGVRGAGEGAPYDLASEDGRWAADVKFGMQGIRDLDAGILRLARWVGEKPAKRRACLMAVTPGISPERLRREWDSARALLQPRIAGRVQFIVVGGASPSPEPSDPWLRRIWRALPKESRPAGDAPAALGPKFFEVLKVLTGAWLRRQGAVSIAEIRRIVGCSYPTAARALGELERAGELERESRRRVGLRGFPRKTWGQLLALSSPLRKPVYFTDGTGRTPDPAALLRRLERKPSRKAALGGVHAARHWDPRFDLHGVPRLDLSVHAPEGKCDLEFVREIDPGLRPVRSASERSVLVVHAVVRADALFEADGKGGLPWADPVETLLDLHELRLVAQAERLIAHLGRGKPR